jgi:hypothetical protein
MVGKDRYHITRLHISREGAWHCCAYLKKDIYAEEKVRN